LIDLLELESILRMLDVIINKQLCSKEMLAYDLRHLIDTSFLSSEGTKQKVSLAQSLPRSH